MTKELWTITEVIEIFQIDERFLAELEEEEIVCPICREDPPAKLFSSSELEKLRLAKMLRIWRSIFGKLLVKVPEPTEG